MKKILFIIQSYPSEKSANVLCDEKVMKQLVGTGRYEVHCLCFKYFGQKYNEKIDGVYVHRWNRGLWWNIYTKAEFRTMSNSKLVIELHRLAMRVKQIVCIPIFPFYEPIVALKYAKEAQKLNQKEQFDMVVAEHNGLDTIFAAWKLKQKNRSIKFMPIFWDAMSGGFRPKYLPAKYVDAKKHNLEVAILHDCDEAIMMQSHKRHIMNLYQHDDVLKKIKFLDIPYLVEQKVVPTQMVFDNENVNLVFAGNMSMRNPEYLLALISASKKKNIVVHFFTEKMAHKKIMSIAQKYDISIMLYDYIPHNELIKYLASADILVNFGVDNPNAISGKIFEYMGFLKPIVSTYFRDDEAVLPFLRKYPMALLIDERIPVDLQAGTFNNFIANIDKPAIAFSELRDVFKDNTPESYLQEIEKLI